MGLWSPQVLGAIESNLFYFTEVNLRCAKVANTGSIILSFAVLPQKEF